MNIYQRINKVRRQVEYVQKDASISAGGSSYRAVSHDAVTAALRKQMVEHGIVFRISLLSAVTGTEMLPTMEAVGETKSGMKKWRYSALFNCSLINADEPGDIYSAVIPAHAEDFGDKAPGKALSYAAKSFLLKAFSLETGESDESRAVDPQDTMVNHTFEVAEGLVDVGDTLGLYLLSREVGDLWPEVYNAAPAGQKVKWKEQLKAAEKQGFEIMGAIKQAIAEEDAGLAVESLDGLTAYGKQLLFKALGGSKSAQLGGLVKAVEGK